MGLGDIGGAITDAGKGAATTITDAGKTVATTATEVATTVADGAGGVINTAAGAVGTGISAAGGIVGDVGSLTGEAATIQKWVNLYEKYKTILIVVLALLAFCILWSWISMFYQWCKCCLGCAKCWGHCCEGTYRYCLCPTLRCTEKCGIKCWKEDRKLYKKMREKRRLAKEQGREYTDEEHESQFKCLPEGVKEEMRDHRNLSWKSKTSTEEGGIEGDRVPCCDNVMDTCITGRGSLDIG
ncbi:hypothetical protein TREMEDRAFT_65479 [Tremella mesenterica DSM 1558]|uniref:uncharacterized protein n=1 Tax=Tremella mesenterica (strain ATCC 24925 / CBS 8224 / DSM 1558 / NBRC 9311 / NRRL Y-6157 / RJB 2259-6 / UBC 559-6) TaxID=578456 RepID=UPI00032CECDF|nr:uncharacterized protein TREMEDRAFT_65479 [Tremella mesenterica DSM 1558]EIW66609.1 hypothetical protein TREMEDRAFT_65479 [Tremella mesenterica DSM 1558]